MQQADLLWLLLFFVGLLFIFLFFRKKPPLKYQALDNLFTPSERRFYKELQQVLPKGCYLFAKVRVADVIVPRKDGDRSRWRSAFNRVACKHFDYVLCNERFEILCAIELDDASHQRKDRRERDLFLEWACRSAGVALVRFRLQRSYDPHTLRKIIEPFCKRG